MGIYDRDPLDREDIGEAPRDSVKWAQDLMNDDKPRVRLVGFKPTYKGNVNGRVDPATLKAARDMKFVLGYPSNQLFATFGQELYDLLMGRRPQTAAMKARALSRKVKPIPVWSYPLAIRGRLIGYPYQGTHRLGNWQSDRGFDIGCAWGTHVLAPRAGVIGSKWGDLGQGGTLAGKRIYVVTSSGLQYYLAHNTELIARPGQRVVAGQIIARSNFPGTPHLHITCNVGDPYTNILGSVVYATKLRRLVSVTETEDTHNHGDTFDPEDGESGE